ncbi:MAG: 3-isopropylmalate dehydratase small subunit [Ignavibacteriales bacterium]|nr:3-isopropylmalate dehydratase small subunit [Ignavibacteriales bacterium]
MNQFLPFSSRVAPLLLDDIDTDQIIPARFLKVTDKLGLGENLFSDWRYNPDGSPNVEFVLNRPEYQGAAILLVGNNFGCGSSREHAPWALKGHGIRAVISTAFADIFKNNALKNGVLPVVVGKDVHRELCDLVAASPTAELSIDLETQSIGLPGGEVREFPIDGFSKTCLIEGTDELGYLLKFEEQIAAHELLQLDK